MDAFIEIGKMHWSDDTLITFMGATRVAPSGVDLFNILKEFTLLEETGKPQMFFFSAAQNASGRQADIRTLPDVSSHRKVNAPSYE